jgi:hypothetical protein
MATYLLLNAFIEMKHMRLSRFSLPVLALAVAVAPAFAQNPGDYPNNPPSQPSYPQTTQNNYPPPPPPNGDMNMNGNMQGRTDGAYPHFPSEPPVNAVPVPAALTIPAGKYLTVRTNGFITSDRNQPGDFFSATLTEPLVIDGFVVAARGQVVNGRVVDVQKAGRVSGVSSVRVELTELNLVDGQQIPFRSQMIYRKGDTSIGRDVGAIGGTTAVGAAIGAAATGTGLGAGIGAAAGLVASTIGVLSTRGRATIVAPETPLTFRVEQPITVSTVRSPNAFAVVNREDYGPSMRQGPRGYQAGSYGYPGAAPYAYAGAPVAGYPYPYYYGAPYFGGVYFYGGRGFYGRGYRRW